MDSSRSNCNGYRILDFLDDEQMTRLGDAGQWIKSWRVSCISSSFEATVEPPCTAAPEPVVFLVFYFFFFLFYFYFVLFVDDLALTVTRVESVLLLLSQLIFAISLAFSQKLDGQSASKPYLFTHPPSATLKTTNPVGFLFFFKPDWTHTYAYIYTYADRLKTSSIDD